MNFYDTVQAKSSELAGLISLTLGLCLITCSCWLLHRTISSESLVYYSYGLRIGGLRLETTSHMEAYHFLSTLVSPYVTVIKIAASLGIIGGVLQVGSSLLTLKSAKVALRIWLGMTFLAFLLSLTTLILPVSYRLMHSMETKILVTIASLNALMLVHLFVVVCIQIKRSENTEADVDAKAEDSSVNKPASAATVTGTGNEGGNMPNAASARVQASPNTAASSSSSSRVLSVVV